LLKKKQLSSTGKLLLAQDLARGLTDIHSIDAPKSRNVTFVHNDVNIANLVAVGPRIKFGDFNIGIPLKWNKTRPCGYLQRWLGILWRSPKEIANTSYVNEKTDVYALGNVLFQTMT
jgi:serine/threonine protein kinase